LSKALPAILAALGDPNLSYDDAVELQLMLEELGAK
jgi:hypothetical protein